MKSRADSIGASEVAALFGCSPWQSEYGLWMLKTGLAEEQEATERMKAGLYLEEAILAEWARRNRDNVLFVNHNSYSFTSQQHDFITATPDGVGRTKDDEPFVADVKTVEPARRGDWESGVPEYYLWQMRQQMYVTGTNKALLVAQFGFHEAPRHEWVAMDPALQDELVRRCCAFWKRVVGELPPPEADGHKATTEALSRRRTEAKAIELGADAREWTQVLAVQDRRMKEAKAIAQEARNKIRAAMGDASTGIFSDGSGWRVQTINRKESVVKASSYTTMKRIKNKDAEDGEGEDDNG